MNSPKIFFYVQHLLGIGHIKRASLLVQAWLNAGFEVTVAAGGEPVETFGFPGTHYLQLDPIKASDSAFSTLVDSLGAPLDDAFKTRRKQQLLTAFEQSQADFLIIENYPFGRRQLRWELKPLLQLASQQQAKPQIICSVRDILQARKPERINESLQLVEDYFDKILVHGNVEFIPLQDSVPGIESVADKLFYTGYVTATDSQETDEDRLQQNANNKTLPGDDEVIVSSGGGAVGYQLMATALKAKTHSSLSHLTWRFLLGPNLTDQERHQLNQLATEGCIIESIRNDFPQVLSRCRLSISQAGYNTIMDILLSQCRAVLVPFTGSGETEQITRTQKLMELGRCVMLEESSLTVDKLISAIDQASATSTSIPKEIQLTGGDNSANYLHRLWQTTQASL